MKDQELLNLWKSYDQKLEEVLLFLNKEIVKRITLKKLSNTILGLKNPKRAMLLFVILSSIILYFITFISTKAGGKFVTIGFGVISMIMTLIIFGYLYQFYLISQISKSLEVIEVQKKLIKLKLSSFNLTRLAIVQLPFWSICWMSMDAFLSSPFFMEV